MLQRHFEVDRLVQLHANRLAVRLTRSPLGHHANDTSTLLGEQLGKLCLHFLPAANVHFHLPIVRPRSGHPIVNSHTLLKYETYELRIAESIYLNQMECLGSDKVYLLLLNFPNQSLFLNNLYKLKNDVLGKIAKEYK